MIFIYNVKGVLVALSIVVCFVILALVTKVFGLSFALAGVVGLLVSIRLSRPYAGYLKLPHIFFIPTHVFSVLIIIMGLIGLKNDGFERWEIGKKSTPISNSQTRYSTSNTSFNNSTLIENDMTLVSASRHTGDTAAIGEMDRYMRAHIITQLKPDLCSYLLRYSPDSSSIFVLIRMHSLDMIRSEIKDELVRTILTFFRSSPRFAQKEMYIGIMDGDDLFYIKTPAANHHVSFGGKDDLAAFYKIDKDSSQSHTKE